jgi:threonine synthase
MRAMIWGERVTDEETLETIRHFRGTSGVFLDPHTAAGVRAAQRFLEECYPNVGKVITLGTAHPAKFGEIVEEATGARPDIPERLARVLDLEKQATRIENSTDTLNSFLADHFLH